ncbi:peptidoglycan-binding protein [Pararhizobium haloflavum]|uniref:peptidoglycan-binding protein n=1 Tax=Pararhizobium haloflavum TaxID=2037914 RepID=UPI000C175B9E|nr:peptidoglycan-binding protein [Pararhizobium haloflavum]
MNESRSESRNHSEDSASVGAIGRTIDALETRLDAVMSARGDMSPHDEEAGKASPAPADDAAVDTDNPLHQIRARQRRLDAFRARTAELRAAAETSSQAKPHASSSASTAGNGDLRDVAQALVALRRELRVEIRNDLSEDIARHVGALRGEMVHIRSLAERETMPDAIRADLLHLSQSIDTLGQASQAGDVAAMQADREVLQQLVEGLAREETVRSLDNRWADICAFMQEADPGAVRDEIAALTKRMDVLSASMAVLPDNEWSQRIEGELNTIVSRLQAPDGDETARFDHLNARLDEISQAIIAVANSAEPALGDAMIERVEVRLAEMSDQLAERDEAAAVALAPHLERLASRIEQLAQSGDTRALAERLDLVAVQIAGLSGEGQSEGMREIAAYLEDLSGRIDALAASQTNAGELAVDRALLDRFETLIERAEAQETAQSTVPGLEGLQRQLEEISGRLDQSDRQSPASEAAVRGLEEQITLLTRLMSERGDEIAPRDTASVLEPRLAAIETRLSQNQDDVIAAASRAAEAAVASFLESGADEFAGGVDELTDVQGLAEDLRALEKLTRMSDERNARTFDAIHDTLLKIANRLESLDRHRTVAPSVADDHPVETASAEKEKSENQDRLDEEARVSAHGAGLAAPAVAAASATAGVTSEPRSLLGRLTQRVRPKQAEDVRREPETSQADVSRAQLEPTPSIDPVDQLDSSTANMPLEPGSGAPDIDRILQKVREQQSGGIRSGSTGYSETEKSDFIAAARRAAQAAAADVENTSKKKGDKAGRSGQGSETGSRRRPILIAVGAVLLAVMSYPLAAGFLADDAPSPEPVVAEREEEPSAAPVETAETAGPAQPQQAREEAPTRLSEAVAPSETPTETAEPLPTPREMTQLPQVYAPDGGQDPAIARDPASTSSLSPNAPASDEAARAAAPAPETESSATDPAVLAERVDALPDDIAPIALIEAARGGDSRALFEIGARFGEGRNVESDAAAAATWYRASAEDGFAPAQYRLGNLYEKGTGVERDLAEAKRWYLAAADKGNASAMHNLAVLYATPSGGEAPDYELAAEWFEAAANHGISDSQFNLAVLYARGSGVDQDLGQSYKWFALAAADGDSDAAAKRDEVANALDADALAEAKAAVDLWQPQPLDPAANTVELPEAWGVSETRTAAVDVDQAVRNIQALLTKEGFDAGVPDGVVGRKTVEAIKGFQEANGMEPTGRIDEALVRALLAESQKG